MTFDPETVPDPLSVRSPVMFKLVVLPTVDWLIVMVPLLVSVAV